MSNKKLKSKIVKKYDIDTYKKQNALFFKH
jgi:hypothetical protein